MLRPLFPRVAGVTPTDQREHRAGLHQAVGEVLHQVVLHFQLRRYVHAVAVKGPEHVAHAVEEQFGGFQPVVSVAHHGAAHHIVGVVSLYPVAVLHRTREVTVVEGDLAERIGSRVA